MLVFYSLIPSLKTYHRTIIGHFTPWSLDLFIRVPFQLPGEHLNFHPLEVVGRGSETQLQVDGNLNKMTQWIMCLCEIYCKRDTLTQMLV